MERHNHLPRRLSFRRILLLGELAAKLCRHMWLQDHSVNVACLDERTEPEICLDVGRGRLEERKTHGANEFRFDMRGERHQPHELHDTRIALTLARNQIRSLSAWIRHGKPCLARPDKCSRPWCRDPTARRAPATAPKRASGRADMD